MNSFIRKYSLVSGISEAEMRNLFNFRPVIIGSKQNVKGALFSFFYSIHTIPCIGFEVELDDKSIYFSGDTFYDPETYFIF
jgi:hypothetical protein